jgi:hypothetical protein
MKRIIFIIFLFLTVGLYGRNYTELMEWRGKNLPKVTKQGVKVEIYDFKAMPGVKYDYPGINIRVHNRGTLVVEELIVSVWFWTKDGVQIKELTLVGEHGGHRKKLFSGEEEYMPSEKRYYKFKNLKFQDITTLEIRISKVRVR